MIAQHIGNAARPPLTALLDDADPTVVQRVQSVLGLLGEAQADWLAWLAEVTDAPVQRVLEELLRENKLRKAALPALQRLFTTAHQRNKPNPVLLAVFGLYVHGATVKEIAARLQRAPSSVRNYITILYQIFELPLDNTSGLQARRKQLRMLAQQRAFIR
jgi:DNA-binding NarL/FixJ family response regulator